MLLWLFGLYVSCTPQDYVVPKAAEPKDIILNNLNAILGAAFQKTKDMEILTFEQDLVLEAFVVSSDKTGNFYKELVIQDAPVNPKAGIAVQINQPKYYETFDFGRRIYVKLKGLSIGELNGILALGIVNGKVIEAIPRSQIQTYLTRTSEVAEIKPLPVKVMDFDDRMENLYVQLEHIQFPDFLVNSDNRFTFASEDNDEFDGERRLESCNGDFAVVLSTSTYSDFKSLQLPQGSGSLKVSFPAIFMMIFSRCT